MLIKEIRDAIKTINNPEPVVKMLLVILAIRYFMPDIIVEIKSLAILQKALPDLFIIFKAISIGMYFYGTAGAILFLICFLLSGLEKLLEKINVYNILLPGGWPQATYDIWSIGILWYWILAGYIYSLGGKPWFPKLVEFLNPRTDTIDIMQVFPFLMNIFVLGIFLLSFASNLFSFHSTTKIINIKVINPIRFKNNE
ncbi:MAG: hypothetical protein PHX14_12680 [Syntrophomonadaceae bacterium]|nr:hypothetical protein [Syntrophomonadaceae bacterium]